MPKPELYVIFTGKRKAIPDILSLTNEFFGGNRTPVDVEAKVLSQENDQDIIGQYIFFSKIYNEQRKLCDYTKQTVLETIRICKDRNVLREYLEIREQEVVDVMMTLFGDEYILDTL